MLRLRWPQRARADADEKGRGRQTDGDGVRALSVGFLKQCPTHPVNARNGAIHEELAVAKLRHADPPVLGP